MKRERMHLTKRTKVAGVLLAIGLIATLAFALSPVGNSEAYTIQEGGNCGSCHGDEVDSVLTYSGVPTTYTPGNVYTITIQIVDGAGAQAFDLIVSAGTLSNPSSNAEIDSATEASAKDSLTLLTDTTFSVDWTAPASGTVTFNFWGVSGDGASGTLDPWDLDTVSIAEVPEFPTMLIPVMGMIGAVLVVSVLAKKGRQ